MGEKIKIEFFAKSDLYVYAPLSITLVSKNYSLTKLMKHWYATTNVIVCNGKFCSLDEKSITIFHHVKSNLYL